MQLKGCPTPMASAFARMDAHRQTFHALINALTTYKPAMLEVKQAYDAALDRATDSVQLHYQLTRKLASAQHPSSPLDLAKAPKRSCIAGKSAASDLESQLQQADAAAHQADSEARAAEAAVNDAGGRLCSLQRQVLDLKQSIASLRADMLGASSWQRSALCASPSKAVLGGPHTG